MNNSKIQRRMAALWSKKGLPPGVKIKKANEADRLLARRLVYQEYKRRNYIKSVADLTRNPPDVTFVAVHCNKIVGTASLIGAGSCWGPEKCEITQFVVNKEYRKTSVAPHLIRRCAQYAIYRQKTAIRIRISPSHETFYEAIGFCRISDNCPSRLIDEDMVVVMEIKITPETRTAYPMRYILGKQ